MRPSTISGTYRSGQQRFFLNALVPKVDYYGVLVDSLNLRSLIGADTFNYRLSFKRMAVFDQLEAINVQLRGQAREDRIINTSIPFGGEFILPFLDFYSVGGPNSLRAFRTREVGPGTRRPNPQQDVFNLLRGKGDIKLEANLEYRWRLGQYLELATFLDAGNVWLFRQRGVGDEEKFEFSDFYKEIALGTGLGIRIDISGLLLRLDFGMPLRKPWRPLGDRWVTDEIDFADPKWRRENLVWNLAFGYPF